MKSKKILFLGQLCISEINIKNLLKDLSIDGFEMKFIRDFDKIKKRFSYKDYSSKKYEAIIVGQVPHKAHGTGEGRSLASEICTCESDVPVYICRDETGRLKATKQSLSKVLKVHFGRDSIEQIDLL